jgi:succinate dehydrogenase / fumarate reductase, cytochrome b subunit
MGVSLPENPMPPSPRCSTSLANPWMLAVYIIAMIAICWHFATASGSSRPSGASRRRVTARKRFGYVCVALRRVLAVMGLASIWAFVGRSIPTRPTTCPSRLILQLHPSPAEPQADQLGGREPQLSWERS